RHAAASYRSHACRGLHTVCGSFRKISSARRATVCGGSRSAKRGRVIGPVSLEMARDGSLSKWGVGSRSSAARSVREIELQALATLAALAQTSTPSAAHFLKSHQLLVQKFAADRDRQKKAASSSRCYTLRPFAV